jgi:hypothetical protein
MLFGVARALDRDREEGARQGEATKTAQQLSALFKTKDINLSDAEKAQFPLVQRLLNRAPADQTSKPDLRQLQERALQVFLSQTPVVTREASDAGPGKTGRRGGKGGRPGKKVAVDKLAAPPR